MDTENQRLLSSKTEFTLDHQIQHCYHSHFITHQAHYLKLLLQVLISTFSFSFLDNIFSVFMMQSLQKVNDASFYFFLNTISTLTIVHQQKRAKQVGVESPSILWSYSMVDNVIHSTYINP